MSEPRDHRGQGPRPAGAGLTEPSHASPAGPALRARPVPAASDRPFWDGLRAHRLTLPYCDDCGAYRYPPAPRCPRCLTADLSWRECPGRGTLWSWATARRRFAPGLGLPYTVVQVELDAQPGLLLDSTLAGSETQAAAPPLRIGLPLTAVYLDDPRGFTVHAFQPDGADS
jgi:uncharacterized OB-fold protein